MRCAAPAASARRNPASSADLGHWGYPSWQSSSSRSASARTLPHLQQWEQACCVLAAGGRRTEALHYAVCRNRRGASPKGSLGAHRSNSCLLYTSDAADDLLCVDLG